MEFGIAVGHISAVDFAQHAERPGFTRCRVPDTPLIRSNPFATMAAVALKTTGARALRDYVRVVKM